MQLNLQVGSPLYTDQTGLFFVFDLGIDPDPDYCGSVQGKLFCDQEKNIVLEIRPLDWDEEHPTPVRREILFAHTRSFTLEFFGQKKAPFLREVTPSLAWHKQWDPERTFPPSQIRCQIQESDTSTLSYVFYVAFPETPITYAETG